MSIFIQPIKDSKSKKIQDSNINQFQFTENFLNKLTLCKINDISHELYWIYDSIINGDSLQNIALKYLAKYEYNGQYTTSSSCALFDAFIQYKNGKYYDPYNTFIQYKNCKYYDRYDAQYLMCTSGTLDVHVETHEITGKLKKITFFSVKDLICELDGTKFFEWFESIITNINNKYK